MDNFPEPWLARVAAKIKALEDERALLVPSLLADEVSDLERSNVTERFVRLTHYLTALKWVVGERNLL